jgi:hypothetical protein
MTTAMRSDERLYARIMGLAHAINTDPEARKRRSIRNVCDRLNKARDVVMGMENEVYTPRGDMINKYTSTRLFTPTHLSASDSSTSTSTHAAAFRFPAAVSKWLGERIDMPQGIAALVTEYVFPTQYGTGWEEFFGVVQRWKSDAIVRRTARGPFSSMSAVLWMTEGGIWERGTAVINRAGAASMDRPRSMGSLPGGLGVMEIRGGRGPAGGVEVGDLLRVNDMDTRWVVSEEEWEFEKDHPERTVTSKEMIPPRQQSRRERLAMDLRDAIASFDGTNDELLRLRLFRVLRKGIVVESRSGDRTSERF